MSNGLTYAQASKRLKELQYAKAQMGQLSINDEIHKKALEIALPILEQHEQGEGWIEWGDGECPVDAEVVVSVKYRGDKWAHQEGEAAKFDWRHRGWCADTDIIAYRIIPERDTNQNGEQ